MKTALIQIRSDATAVLAKSIKQAKKAVQTGVPSDPVTTFMFNSSLQFFTVISPKRWKLIEHLQKIGPVCMCGLARSLERDIKRVHDDVAMLIYWGIIKRTNDSRIYVPYDVIHADFDLRATCRLGSHNSACSPRQMDS